MPRRPVPLWYVFLAGFISLGLGLWLALFAVTSYGRSSRAATCDVIAAALAEKRAKLDSYNDAPPTTETGRRLEESERASLVAWDRLWSTYRCQGAKSHG